MKVQGFYDILFPHKNTGRRYRLNTASDLDAVQSRGKIFSHKKHEGLSVCGYRHFPTADKNREDITGKTAVARKWFLSHIYALKRTSLYNIVSLTCT